VESAKKRLLKSTPPVKIPIIGLIRSSTRLLTIAVKAAPMMMPTARSMALPRAMKSRNSLSMWSPDDG
jgi:hypothetical protein